MNLSYPLDVLANPPGFNLTGRPLFGLALIGLLLMSGCATQPPTVQSSTISCLVTPETVTATQRQAEGGDAASQYQIGLWYQYAGGCLKPDKTKAAEWFRRAAEQGHIDAQYQLGHMYYYGHGVEKDDDEAARWYQKAAEQGHSLAAWWLGNLYASGSRVARDADRAEYWYRRAFEGNAISQTTLDQRLADLENKQEEQRLVEKRKREQQRLADEGDPEAQYELGFLYSGSSDYIEQDLAQAFKWFEKSADQGHADAQVTLGRMYEQGIGGIPKDVQNAKDLYQKAADQGHVLAKRRLCELSEDCTPVRATGATGDEFSPWMLLCFTPWTIALCAAMGG